jgi:hypothetical protein
MSSLLQRWLPKPLPTEAVLLPADRFFVMRVELDPATPARSQVELALEASSPFPANQLLLGLVHGADGRSALAFAAHKRRFTAEEIASWPASSTVVPEFLALLGQNPNANAVLVHFNDERAIALAWRANESLPTSMVSFATADGTPEAAAAEAALLAELPANTPVIKITGAIKGRGDDKGLSVGVVDGPNYHVASRSLDDADVRDAGFLEKRRGQAAWEKRAWLMAQITAACLLLAALADASAAIIHWRTNEVTAVLDSNRTKVEELEGLNSLAAKISELGDNRPLPFEMLSVVNSRRPASLTFQGIACKGGAVLEVEAKTTRPEDVSAFEQALRAESTLISKAETRDLRARDGNTTFTITITFRADALRKAAKSE